ncbi:hypothetical protein HY024_03960 [Candidatus Curtissbacteria bacterium]|nr:hypothetical protein [Candidatus Curtissbacteria bacterium]
MDERYLDQDFSRVSAKAINAIGTLRGLEAFTNLRGDGTTEIDRSYDPEMFDDIVGRRIQGVLTHTLAGIDQMLIYDKKVRLDGVSRRAFMVGETGFACIAPETQMGLIDLVAVAKRRKPRPAADSEWKLVSAQLICTLAAKAGIARPGQ